MDSTDATVASGTKASGDVAPVPVPAFRRPTARPGQAITVLLADDHTMVRQALSAVVSRESDIAVVAECGTGLETLEAVKRLRPAVAVLDIHMPGLNGLDTCRELTRRFRDVAILILTMYGDEEFIRRALENGASGYLQKDAAADQLPQAIRTVAQGETYLGPGIPSSVLHSFGARRGDPYDSLTPREKQVLQLIAEGRTNREAAEILGIAMRTVDTHRTRLMKKLNIHDQQGLILYAIKRGIIGLR